MAKLIERDITFADTAPVIVERVGTIDGTPDEVWAAILDYERWPVWFTSIKTCRHTSEQQFGIGSTREVLLGGGMKVTERFIAWDEPNVWGFTAIEAPPVFQSLVERVTITPLGDGTSEVAYRMAIGPRKGLGPVIKLAQKGIGKGLSDALGKLSTEVTRRRTAA